jgi:hypothetical protein
MSREGFAAGRGAGRMEGAGEEARSWSCDFVLCDACRPVPVV